jgi:hypothetical protein
MIHLRCSTLLLGAVALCACDRQVDRGYQGESLLQIQGNVVIPLGLEGRELVPAIAFPVASERAKRLCAEPESDHLRYVEVEVSGDFPSSFQLDLYDPPPAEALRRFDPGGPELAIGYVAALTRNHPDAVLIRPNSQKSFELWPPYAGECTDEQADAGYGDADVTDAGVTEPSATRCFFLQSCTLDARDCLRQTLECESGPLVFYSDCELIESEGNETLAAAGYSVNYRVVYFADRVQAGSPTAEAFTGGDAAAAGYHLYHLAPTSETPPETQGCLQSAALAAVERYNAEHDTEYTPYSLSLGGMYDHLFDEVDYELWAMLRCEQTREIKERGCHLAARPFAEEVIGKPIAIELGAANP